MIKNIIIEYFLNSGQRLLYINFFFYYSMIIYDNPNNPKSKKKPTYANVSVPGNDPPSDQSTQFISKFLEELKSILSPLLMALTTIINKFHFPSLPFHNITSL